MLDYCWHTVYAALVQYLSNIGSKYGFAEYVALKHQNTKYYSKSKW